MPTLSCTGSHHRKVLAVLESALVSLSGMSRVGRSKFFSCTGINVSAGASNPVCAVLRRSLFTMDSDNGHLTFTKRSGVTIIQWITTFRSLLRRVVGEVHWRGPQARSAGQVRRRDPQVRSAGEVCGRGLQARSAGEDCRWGCRRVPPGRFRR